jgi:hypothetical protein
LPILRGKGEQAPAKPDRSGVERCFQRWVAVPGQPAFFHGLNKARVALADLVDVDAAGEEVEGELGGIEGIVVTGKVFPPAQAAACLVLDFGHLRLALGLVVGEGSFEIVLVRSDFPDQGDGVLHGHLGPGSYGEVCGVHGIAQQDDVALVPGPRPAGAEIRPAGAVGHQRFTGDVLGKKLFEETLRLQVRGSRGLADIEFVEPGLAPGFLIGFDNEGAQVVADRVAVDREVAELALPVQEGHALEDVAGSEPDELRRGHLRGVAQALAELLPGG